MQSKYLVIALIAISVLRQSFSIDPEYVLDRRLQQIVQALVNAVEDTSNTRLVSPKENSVTFWCARPNRTTYQEVLIGDPNVDMKINLEIPTAFLIHGWFDSVNRTWMNKTIATYVKNIHSNICGVDWSRLALTEYTIAANNTKVVAKYLSKFIRFLTEKGLQLDHVKLIGHSMGAQIAGITGEIFNGTISEIIGLDPAGWLFTKPTLVEKQGRLDRSDAKFVQCIHTAINYMGLGSDVDCGHQDYYPNGGFSPQPGCNNPIEENGMTYTPLICSHYKSVQYFMYSLDQKNKFEGFTCSLGYLWWDLGFCQRKTIDRFGMYSKKRTGQFFFRTTSNPPFAIKF